MERTDTNGSRASQGFCGKFTFPLQTEKRTLTRAKYNRGAKGNGRPAPAGPPGQGAVQEACMTLSLAKYTRGAKGNGRPAPSWPPGQGVVQ